MLDFVIPDRDGNGTFAANQYHQPLGPGYRCVKEITLQHDVVLRKQRHDHGGIFGALRLVYRDGIGQHQVVEITQLVIYHPVFEFDLNLLFVKVNTD